MGEKKYQQLWDTQDVMEYLRLPRSTVKLYIAINKIPSIKIGRHRRFMKDGVYVQESLKTKSFVLAVRLTDEIESSILLGVNWRKEKEYFETAWPDFISDKAKGIKTRIARESTLKQYLHIADKYLEPFFNDKRLCDIDEESWSEFVEQVRTNSPNFVFFNSRKYLISFLSWAKRKGKIQEVPELFKPDARAELEDDESDAPGRLYTEYELLALRTHSLTFSNDAFRLYLLMAMLMGMRSSEITQLKKNRIDWSAGVIRLRPIDTKNKEARSVPIHSRVWGSLKIQCDSWQDSPCVFSNRWDRKRPMDAGGFKKPWIKLREELNIEGRFHDFKHTFITMALAKRMNPVVVSKIVGTSISVIEKVYLHLRDEDLAAELGKLQL